MRFGQYPALAAATATLWLSNSGSQARTAIQPFIAAGIGPVFVKIAVWLFHRSMKARKTGTGIPGKRNVKTKIEPLRLNCRGLAGYGYKPDMFNSDQGGQFAGEEFIRLSNVNRFGSAWMGWGEHLMIS